jgi:hypothetical protein
MFDLPTPESVFCFLGVQEYDIIYENHSMKSEQQIEFFSSGFTSDENYFKEEVISFVVEIGCHLRIFIDNASS